MIPTLEVLLASCGHDVESEEVGQLIGFLRQREDAIKEAVMVFAMRFGLHAEIVAEVFANGGLNLGTPLTDEARAFIHQTYVNHIEQLRRQQGEG